MSILKCVVCERQIDTDTRVEEIDEVNGQPACLNCREEFLLQRVADLEELRAELGAENAILRAALKRAEPWLGKAIAENVHKHCAGAGDLPRTLEIVRDILK